MLKRLSRLNLFSRISNLEAKMALYSQEMSDLKAAVDNLLTVQTAFSSDVQSQLTTIRAAVTAIQNANDANPDPNGDIEAAVQSINQAATALQGSQSNLDTAAEPLAALVNPPAAPSGSGS